jgi:hypothetical protein
LIRATSVAGSRRCSAQPSRNSLFTCWNV